MAGVLVTITPKRGEPRQLHLDDFRGPDGAEIRRGASMIDTLRRQERRGELVSVVVEPEPSPLPPSPEKVAAAKKSTARKDADAA